MRRSVRRVRRSARNVSGEEGESGRLSTLHGGMRNMERQRGGGA